MITLFSHGFKYGSPRANFVFDVSYLKNPWRDPKLRGSSVSARKKLRPQMAKFMDAQPEYSEYCKKIADVVSMLDRLFPGEDIRIAICCSAGEYRSPMVVEGVKKLLRKNNIKFVHEK